MTPEDIAKVRFQSVRRGGYQASEVEAFLADAADALVNADGAMTPADVRDARFTLVKRGGLDTQEVDLFLDNLMDAMVALKDRSAVEGSAALGGSTVKTGNVRTVPAGADTGADAVVTEPPIRSDQLRNLKPPEVDGLGYDATEVDFLLSRVADTLDLFEKVDNDGDLGRLRGTQYAHGDDGAPLLMVGDQVRAALFTVRSDGGYDTRGVDAAVRRLGSALDYHWRR